MPRSAAPRSDVGASLVGTPRKIRSHWHAAINWPIKAMRLYGQACKLLWFIARKVGLTAAYWVTGLHCAQRGDPGGRASWYLCTRGTPSPASRVTPRWSAPGSLARASHAAGPLVAAGLASSAFIKTSETHLGHASLRHAAASWAFHAEKGASHVDRPRSVPLTMPADNSCCIAARRRAASRSNCQTT